MALGRNTAMATSIRSQNDATSSFPPSLVASRLEGHFCSNTLRVASGGGIQRRKANRTNSDIHLMPNMAYASCDGRSHPFREPNDPCKPQKLPVPHQKPDVWLRLPDQSSCPRHRRPETANPGQRSGRTRFRKGWPRLQRNWPADWRRPQRQRNNSGAPWSRSRLGPMRRREHHRSS